MRMAVAGASGYVGGVLVERLTADGHTVVALGRNAKTLPDGVGVEPVEVDVADLDALTDALRGSDAAYYLVHSMTTGGDFRSRDRELAETFGAAAAAAGVGRIVYLGGLGEDPTSEHLQSRQEVGRALGDAGVPVVELRAAVILGAGSISFEMLRHITGRLPVMVCPRWVRTRIQPLAERDLLEYLVQSLAVEPRVYEVGGADVTSYEEMIEAYARVRGLRPRLIVNIPLLTPHLSAYWVDLVTPVDRDVSHSLIESLTTEVVVQDPGPTAAAFTVEPLGLDDSIRAALDSQLERAPIRIFDRGNGVDAGIYAIVVDVPMDPELAGALDDDLGAIGGSQAWYGFAIGWWLRITFGRLFGERMKLGAAAEVTKGARVDWWTVVERDPGVLLLASVDWFFGEAWLGWQLRVSADGTRATLHQVGALRTKGVPGVVYWFLLVPIHRRVFRNLAELRVSRARAAMRAGTTSAGGGAATSRTGAFPDAG
ncbi:MAG: NAD(P)-dependent oxidoreductase [Actinomycetia bacterium]|nr:NAD(P)-dependent oxidoreductase [Actinomycetes bacterium]